MKRWSLLFALTLSACGLSWGSATRLALGTFEASQKVVATAATKYEQKREEEYRQHAAQAKSLAEIDHLEQDEAKFHADYGKVVDGLNKLWTATTAVKVTLPLVEQAADKSKRAQIDQWLSTGLVTLLELRDALSKFGVVIPAAGGAQ